MDDLNSVDELDPNSAPPLMCLLEEPRGGMGTDERVSIAMVSIAPSTGDVVWDEFDGVLNLSRTMKHRIHDGSDNHMRTELEVRVGTDSGPLMSNNGSAQTRLVHTKPYELLLPAKKLTAPSEKMIQHFTE